MRNLRIENDAELEQALARLKEIWSAKEGDEDWEEHCQLTKAVAEYEEEHFPIEPPSPIDAILFRMEQGDLTRRDLEPFIGSRHKVSEVLSGKRRLSRNMILRLHHGLGIPLKSLLGVAELMPEGYTRVDWVLPTTIVNKVIAAADKKGIPEEEWVARNLAITAYIQEAHETITQPVDEGAENSPTRTFDLSEQYGLTG